MFTRWLALIRGLIGSQRVPFTPTESRVVNRVLRDLTGWSRGQSRLSAITIPMVWAALDTPTEELVAECRYQSRQDFFDGTRALRDALGSLCEGELEGLFDTASTFQPNWRAPIQTLSLHSLHADGNEAAVGIALMCLNSWGQGMREMAAPGDRRIVLRDEAWMQTRLGVEAVKTLDSNLRLSRSDGDIQLVTYHKPSDPLSAGDQGSQAAQIAKDLLHLADVRILMGQDEEVAAELGHLLGLTPDAARHRHRLGDAGQGPRPVDGRRPAVQGPDRPDPRRTPPHLHQRRHRALSDDPTPSAHARRAPAAHPVRGPHPDPRS